MLECTAIYGEKEIFDEDPSIFSATNAIYVPVSDPTPWAMYDAGRRAIHTSFYFNGPEPVIQRTITPHRQATIFDEFNTPCFYGGFLSPDFGHFVLSTFSRLWPLCRSDDPALRIIVCHSSSPVQQFFAARPWAIEMIGGLGLTPRNFICFDRPTRVKKITIPGPSFEESNYGYRIFAELCRTVGDVLTLMERPQRSSRPIYLSKERLTTGIRKLANEADAVGLLRAEGIDIIYPETLSLTQQIAVWRDRTAVASFVSSSLHTSIFSPGLRLVAHGDTMIINSSFPLIDGLNGARATYLGMPDGGLIGRAPSPEFGEISYLADPRAYAEAIMEALNV